MKNTSTIVYELRTEHCKNPVGLGTNVPRLSWKLKDNRRGCAQGAYQILAATSPDLLNEKDADLWNTGKIEDTGNLYHRYAGKKIPSSTEVFWKLRIWDEKNKVSKWSDVASFETGLLKTSDWKGKWIGKNRVTKSQPAPLFRREFTLPAKAKRARAYICGIGYHSLSLNGSPASDRLLDPAYTRFDRRVLYVTHDITRLLKKGENAIGIELGNGWLNSHVLAVWNFEQAPWRMTNAVIAEILVECEDGSTHRYSTDEDWMCSTGGTRFDSLYSGEKFDARKEKPGWTNLGFSQRGWKKSEIVPGPGGKMEAMTMNPIRVSKKFKPKSIREVSPGVYVADFGKVVAGCVQVAAKGQSGDTIQMRYAERIYDHGGLDTEKIDVFVKMRKKSQNFQTDTFILKGDGRESWNARFTYHGFRYVEITGYPGKPTKRDLTAMVIHTDFESRGEFRCSNSLLNKIAEATRASFLSNFHSIPTDCPQREKNGWTGDAHLAAEQALLQFDPVRAYEKWLDDFSDAQQEDGLLPCIIPSSGWGYETFNGPAWDSAYILICWYVYLYIGDTEVIKRHFNNLVSYLGMLDRRAKDFLVSMGLGDWVPADTKTPEPLTSSAYYYVDKMLVAKFADILGKKSVAKKLRREAEKTRKAILKEFFNRETGKFANGSQTAQSCALYQGICEPEDVSLVLDALLDEIQSRDTHIDTGILGAKYLPNTLTDHGRTDIAYDIATKTSYPGWGYWIKQGATTLWEDWQGKDSLNHIMFGDITAWMFKALAGIRPDPETPGFRHFLFRPEPVRNLKWVKAWHESPYGTVKSEWEIKSDKLVVKLTVPPNSVATAYLPTQTGKLPKESGKTLGRAKGVQLTARESGLAVLQLDSGQYEFECQL